jgi:hypothetical protein
LKKKIEGRVKVTGRKGKRRKQPMHDHQETRGYRKMKKEAPDSALWKTLFERDCEPVIRQTTELIN